MLVKKEIKQIKMPILNIILFLQQSVQFAL